MTATVRRALRHFLCCLVIVSMIAAVSLPPRQARADGGSGDPVTTAVVLTTVIAFLAFNQMSFLRGFQPRTGPVQIALLVTEVAMRALLLNMLAIRRRTTPLMAQMLATIVLFTVATYAVALTTVMAQRRNVAQTLLATLGLGPLFHTPYLLLGQNSLQIAGNGSNDDVFAEAARRRYDVVRYGDGPADRPVYRNLFADAAKGDPTARTIVALLPRYHAVGYVPRGAIADKVGLAIMELPGMFMTPFGAVYDAAFWDDIIEDAEDAVDCGRCYYELEEAAFWGDWEAELSLDIADEMLAMEHERRNADQPRLLHARTYVASIDQLRRLQKLGTVKNRLPQLSEYVRAAYATDKVTEGAFPGPTWSVPYGYADRQGDTAVVRKSYDWNLGNLQYYASYFDLKRRDATVERKAAINEIEPRRYGIDLNLRF